MSDITASIATAIQAKTGGNVEGEIPEWWAEFIDMVLAELQSAGRLIPAGGMALIAEEWANRITLADKQVAVSEAWEQGFEYGSGHKYGTEDDGVRLTAEQVEDVRTAREALRGYRNFEGSISRGHVRSLIAAVDALFPATEPAEERRVHNHGPTEGRGLECPQMTVDGRLVGYCIAPELWTAPAIPAEEETKAEDYCCHPMCRHTNWGGSNRKHTRGSDCPIVPKPTSSPVVPAPTETGPWQRIEDVPETVGRLTDRDGDIWEWDGDNWVTPETAILPTAYINKHFAPFVAAAEEG